MAAPAVLLLATLATAAAGAGRDAYAYGSGRLGTWQPDRFALPSYALSLENATLLNISSDLHVVGNDRMIANVAADGSLTLRQDEGGPKYLNDYNATLFQFAGGVGWLFGEGAGVLCDTNVSFPPPRGRALAMTFAVGRVEKECVAGGLSTAQTIFAPFGDIPAVVSTVTITNSGAGAVRVRWLEQWAAGAPVILAGNVFRPSTWTAAFEPVAPLGGGGGAPIGVLSRKANPAGDARVPSVDDPQPRPAFLVALDDAGAGVAFGVDGAALFPAADPRAPALAALTNSTAAPPGPDGWRRGVLALASAWLTVPAGGAVSLSFCYGYVPDEGSSAAAVIAAVLAVGGGGGAPALLNASTRAWAGSLSLVLDVPAFGPWVARETAWHSYVLRALLTFDSFRGRHNLNQNGEYQNAYVRGGGPPPAIGGFNGASRDSLAHVMPFSWQAPAGAAVVPETVLFWLQTQLDSGMLAWATAGYGLDWRGWSASTPWLGHVCSDLPVWPLLTAAEYVLATRDAAFLGRVVTRNASGAAPQTVASLLMAAFGALVGGGPGGVGLGAHGLLRLLGSDHNDGFYGAPGIAYGSPLGLVVNATGESVMASATAAFVFGRFADALDFAAAPFNASAARVRDAAAALRAAVAAASAGQAFVPRAWLGDDPRLGWFGVDAATPDAGGGVRVMWMEPQAWAVLAGVLNATAAAALLQRVQARLCDASPTGCQNVAGCYQAACVYAGVDHFSVWPLVWALGAPHVRQPDAALDAWRKASMAVHAEVYPDTFYGITSGPDGYIGPVFRPPGKAPGRADYALRYPTFNSWAHSEPLHSALNVFGAVFTPAGVTLAGGLLNASQYSLATPLLGLARAPAAPPRFSGYYAPHARGQWAVTLFLPPELVGVYARVLVNGACRPARRDGSGHALSWDGEGGADAGPLAWELGAPACAGG